MVSRAWDSLDCGSERKDQTPRSQQCAECCFATVRRRRHAAIALPRCPYGGASATAASHCLLGVPSSCRLGGLKKMLLDDSGHPKKDFETGFHNLGNKKAALWRPKRLQSRCQEDAEFDKGETTKLVGRLK